MTGKVLVASRARRHPIQDHQIGRRFGEAQFGFIPPLDALGHISLGLEIVAEQKRQIRLVLDDENAGRGAGSRAGSGRLSAGFVH